MDEEIAQWLREQPLDEPVEIDGEFVYLAPRQDGAELGAILVHAYSPAQLQEALRLGFQSALHFDAGLGHTADGRNLVLTRWLPRVDGWIDAAAQLEQLLDQLAMWRAALGPRQAALPGAEQRSEQRLRQMLSGAAP
ncbi:hypothetical protein [Rugamonas rubra]|uniref:Tir chaperone protein (CesT) family protein n=1 Tax=Rugamonas rubra TaxID=758825 RepID=A0A1I4M543_9BURK|nr:hypothetical protein [Rugamonas rubra]SFL98115.1 hypothetical protein SAMN02982985_02237 [Rugamonas rubra]